MIGKSYRLKLSRDGVGHVLFSGDWHEGTPACHQEGVARFLECARAWPWVGLGDFCECIIPGDRRFSVEEHGVTLLGQWAKTGDRLKSAAKTCIGCVSANHEAAVSKAIGNLTKALCEHSGVPYLSQTAFVELLGCKRPVRTWVAHGTLVFSGRSGNQHRLKLNREIRIREYLACFDADIQVVGHGHTFVCAAPTDKLRLVQTGATTIHRRPVELDSSWCVMAPALARVYTDQCETWAESRLVNPADLGWADVVLDRTGIKCVRHVNEEGKIVDEATRMVLS